MDPAVDHEIEVRIGSHFSTTARPGEKLIDVCERVNAPVAFGCRAGSCGTCAIVVLRGLEHLSPRGENEDIVIEDLPIAGPEVRLACQVRVFGSVHVNPIA